ncbi:MAG: hypothetical protein EOO38_04915 [Cytophagaceae bacterium]|nr:MAG: hypothetical protein EOO38_04915 [Cytophagaceae bacterium]
MNVQVNKGSIKVQHGRYRIHEVHEPSDSQDSTVAPRAAGYVITDLENHRVSEIFNVFHAAMKEIKKHK